MVRVVVSALHPQSSGLTPVDVEVDRVIIPSEFLGSSEEVAVVVGTSDWLIEAYFTAEGREWSYEWEISDLSDAWHDVEGALAAAGYVPSDDWYQKSDEDPVITSRTFTRRG